MITIVTNGVTNHFWCIKTVLLFYYYILSFVHIPYKVKIKKVRSSLQDTDSVFPRLLLYLFLCMFYVTII